MKKFTFCLTLAVLLIWGAVAQAAPVSNWTFRVEGVFLSYYNTTGEGGGKAGISPIGFEQSFNYNQPNQGTVTGYKELAWGARTPSVLTLNVTEVTTAQTNQALDLLSITHTNEAITGKTLAGGTIALGLSLGTGGSNLYTHRVDLPFYFFETPNVGNHRRDIFVVDMQEIAKNNTFTYMNERYAFDFSAAFSPLTNWYLDYALDKLSRPDGSQLYGWTTAENAITKFNVHMSIQHLGAVPVPAAVWLLGSGLVGLFALRRQKGA